jgi:hypothetical protein
MSLIPIHASKQLSFFSNPSPSKVQIRKKKVGGFFFLEISPALVVGACRDEPAGLKYKTLDQG